MNDQMVKMKHPIEQQIDLFAGRKFKPNKHVESCGLPLDNLIRKLVELGPRTAWSIFFHKLSRHFTIASYPRRSHQRHYSLGIFSQRLATSIGFHSLSAPLIWPP